MLFKDLQLLVREITIAVSALIAHAHAKFAGKTSGHVLMYTTIGDCKKSQQYLHTFDNTSRRKMFICKMSLNLTVRSSSLLPDVAISTDERMQTGGTRREGNSISSGRLV